MSKTVKKKENAGLLNVIAPIDLQFTHTGMQIGENMAKGYGIVRYSPDNAPGWISRITNLPNSIVSITYEPIDSETMIEVLDSNINVAKKRGIDAKKQSEESRADKEIKHSKKLMGEIDDNNESIGVMATVVVPLTDEKSMERVDRKAKGTAKKAKCRMRNMVNMQKDVFKQISPTYIPQDVIRDVTGRVVPLRSLLGGFPFQRAGLNDGSGYYFAKDDAGGILTLDMWKRLGDRTNTNMAVLGVPGVGKSTKVKDMIVDEYMMGTRMIIIDPEDEYKEQCQVLQGSWLNAAGGSRGRINPLQIQEIPVEEGEDEYYKDEGWGMGALALYLKHLETFFTLYSSSIDDYKLSYLKQVLIELYEKHGIRFDTDIAKLKNENYPIIEELVDLLKEKSAEEKENGNGINHYQDLVDLLWDMAYGADAFLFNGYTTIAAETKYTCISTSGLNDASDRIKRTQYFNLLTWAWKEISRNRQERVILVCDEAYLLVDPDIPQSLIFLRNAMKRARKYEAGIWVITQNVIDFMNEKVKMYGQELLDNPAYKIVMGIDGANLEKVVELYHLTEQEITLLEAKRRGHAILMAGSRRMHVKFDIADYKFQYFGTAGGR